MFTISAISIGSGRKDYCLKSDGTKATWSTQAEAEKQVELFRATDAYKIPVNFYWKIEPVEPT